MKANEYLKKIQRLNSEAEKVMRQISVLSEIAEKISCDSLADMLDDIIAEKTKWPSKAEDRDILYFLAQSFRARLISELPKSKQDISGNMLSFVYRAKRMIKDLSTINFEIAQMVVASDDNAALPDWFMIEVIRDLPRLVNGK